MRMSLKLPRLKCFLLLAALCFSVKAAWGQETRFDVSFSIDWARGELNTLASFELAQAGIKLPTGRFMGEELLREAYPRLLKPNLLPLRVDSSSTVRDLVDRGELSLEELDVLSEETEKTPPSLSADLNKMSGRYKISLGKISSLLIRHRQAVEAERPLIPVQTADYTGIIIIADEEIPVHGRRTMAFLEPCLFPKVWDTNMNLVYERNMFDPGKGGLMIRYAARESIFRPTPSGLDGELATLVGPNPLRVFARGVFGINPTDPVIDRDDAMKILSSENNRRLFREGRVALILNAEQLTFTMSRAAF
jgi:hypothetical protein